MIIRQRGRRRSINWSPDKTQWAASALSILRTPTKSTSTMTLRSSPRKRLHLTETQSPTTTLSQSFGQSPRKITRTTSSLAASPSQYTPQSKRSRLTESPIAQQNSNTPLNKVLKGYSQDQLINVIQELCNQEPNIETQIREHLPVPDIKPMEERLLLMKKNIFKSLPTSRLVKNTDSVAYSRAATHLNTFKKIVVEQSHQLNESENWDALIDYVLMAWPIVRATPIWDNKTHNSIRRSCFKILSWHCLCGLKSGSIGLGEQRLTELSRQIDTMKYDCDDVGSSVPYLDNIFDKLMKDDLESI